MSTSIRNEWRSCWSSKQQFPSLKRKPECSVCHWCHRQKTTLQTGNKAAGVFTPKYRGPYLFKPHTPRVPPCFYWRCALIVPTSDSLSGLSHIWLPCVAISISVHLASNEPGQLVHGSESEKQASERGWGGVSQWGMWKDWRRKQSCIYWKAHLGCPDSNLTLI